MKNKGDITAAVITYNEAGRIGRTLASVKNLVSEIVVIDSGSTDETVKIAESFGAKTYIEKWKGFAAQKNSLTEKCSCPWILYLDADEEIMPELADEIKKSVADDKYAGFYIKRKTFYLGKLLKYSWQPDIRLRLAKKSSSPEWVGDIVHEELKITGETGCLKNYMTHYSYRDISDHFSKTVRYARLSAESYAARGRKPSVFKLIFNPIAAFLKLYIIRGAFLDGTAGFIAGVSAFVYAFLKYAFLWEIVGKRNGK